MLGITRIKNGKIAIKQRSGTKNNLWSICGYIRIFSGWWESKLHMKIIVYTWCLLKPTPVGYKLMLNNEQ
jgi:hypothetical protein